MFSFYEFEAHERQNERMRDADNNRMVRLAEMGGRNTTSARNRAMLWVGNRLVASGRKLQTSYR